MPREDREKQKNEALILYKSGMKLVDIAKELDIPQGTIRRWKSEDEWGGERSVKKSNVRKEKSGERIKEEAFLQGETEKVTTKSELFCLYYVKYRNQVKAYQMTFGCSYINACSCASTYMKKHEIKKRINELLEEIRENVEFGIKDVAQKQIDIANADMKDFVELKDGEVKIKDFDQIDGTLIKKIKNTKYGVEVVLKDSQRALEWLGKNQQNSEKQEGNRIELTRRKEPPDDYMDTTV